MWKASATVFCVEQELSIVKWHELHRASRCVVRSRETCFGHGLVWVGKFCQTVLVIWRCYQRSVRIHNPTSSLVSVTDPILLWNSYLRRDSYFYHLISHNLYICIIRPCRYMNDCFMRQCTVVICTKMCRISIVSPYIVAIHIICSKLMIDLNYIERVILACTTNILRPVISYV